MAVGVQAACPYPSCSWVSDPVTIDEDRVNGGWHARHEAARDFRRHLASGHVRSPVFVYTESDEPDVR